MIGVDEVGRGAWAGPLLVVAARQRAKLPSGIADSKKLNFKRRESFIDHISGACDIGEGWVEPAEIDTLGLSEAMKLGVWRALEAIRAESHEEIVIDGRINFCDPSFVQTRALVRADVDVPIVSAASVYAKVARDTYMMNLPSKFEQYGFKSHVGYGTTLHSRLLNLFGPSSIHRFSYKPVQRVIMQKELRN